MKKNKEWKDFKPIYKKGMFLVQANGFRYSFKLVSLLLPKSKKKKYKGKKQIVYELPIFLKGLEVSNKEVAEKLQKENLDKFTRIIGMPCNTSQIFILQLSESAYNQLGVFLKSNLIMLNNTLTYERFGIGYGTGYKFEVLKNKKLQKL